MSKKALGKRELEVLALVCQGKSDKEIAVALFISESTVSAHIRSIRWKMGGVQNRTALALLGRKLLQLPVVRESGLPYGSPAFSFRELEVMRLVQQGAKNKEIAAILVISMNTVKTHVGRIMKKLDVSNRTQAAMLAARFLDESGTP